MNVALRAVFGWIVPGGAYLLARRHLQFAMALVLVCAATIAGVALHGANLWPQAEELQGLDGLAATMAKGGAIARVLAGAPYFLARLCHYSQSFLAGQTHEYGTTLLALAGLFNLLALADALEVRKAQQS